MTMLYIAVPGYGKKAQSPTVILRRVGEVGAAPSHRLSILCMASYGGLILGPPRVIIKLLFCCIYTHLYLALLIYFRGGKKCDQRIKKKILIENALVRVSMVSCL